MDIKILGPGCRNCVTLTGLVAQAVSDLGIQATISKVEDYADIAAFDIMSTPGLVVDGTVVMAGRVPTLAAVKDLLAGQTSSHSG